MAEEEIKEILKTLKAQRSGYIGQVTQMEKMYCEEIKKPGNEKQVVRAKNALDSAIDKCLDACKRYVDKVSREEAFEMHITYHRKIE